MMSVQLIWNTRSGGWDWIDLSYVLGKTDTPDARHGHPVDLQPCGHPASEIIQSDVVRADGGTAYCGACEREAVTKER